MVDEVVDIKALNTITTTETNNAIINIAILLSGTASVINNIYYDQDSALTIIGKALEIRISDPKMSEALLVRLVADR